MKPKKNKSKGVAKAELETFGGGYQRFESTFRLPERFRRVGSGGKGSKGRGKASSR